MFPRLRRHRIWLLISIGMVLIIVLHPLILRAMAWPLCHGDGRQEGSHLLFLRSARIALPAFSFAQQFAARDRARRVLVFRDYIRRAEAIGAGPPFVETTISQLVAAGVPEGQIEVIGDPSIITTEEMFAFVADWMQRQPSSTQLVVVTHLFHTGYVKAVADSRLDAPIRGRISVVGFSRHGITADNWWRSAVGLKSFFPECLRRVHLAIFGQRRPDVSWDPDVYEQQLRKMAP